MPFAEDVRSHAMVKASIARGIKSELVERYSDVLGETLDQMFPKKEPIYLMKW